MKPVIHFRKDLKWLLKPTRDHFEIPAQSRAESFFPASKIFEYRS